MSQEKQSDSAPIPPVTVQSLAPVHVSSSVPPPPRPSVAPPSVSMPVHVSAAPGEVYHAPVHIPEPPKQNVFVQYWRKAGGGSLMISLLIHVGILVGAFFMVKTITTEKQVDFLPGGGSKAGQEASNDLSKQVQAKKRNVLDKKTPMAKVVTTAQTNISLPDVPIDVVDMPEMSSVMGGGSMGSGGFGSLGAGGGFGKGVGIGGMKGITFFGFKTTSRRMAFLVDYSGSMTGQFRKTMEEDLDKSLKALPTGTDVLIIPWAGGAWLYDEKADEEVKKRWVKNGDYDNWSVAPKAKLPKPEWVPITPANVKKLTKGVADQLQWPGGTDWRQPFIYAMQANPPPDTIFFMTDGQIKDSKKALEDIQAALKTAKVPPKVFCLYIVSNNPPDTLKKLAKENKGEFREVGDKAKK